MMQTLKMNSIMSLVIYSLFVRLYDDLVLLPVPFLTHSNTFLLCYKH